MTDPKYCIDCGSLLTTKLFDDIERLTCEQGDCGFISWENPIPVVAGLVDFNGKIILVQNVGWPKEWYGLVTGFLEKEEDPQQGIVREIKEELNLDSQVQGLIGNYIFKEKNQIILAYHLTATGNIQINDELQDYKLVDKNKLQPWPFATGLAVKDWLTSQKHA